MLCAVGEGEEREDDKDGQPPVSNNSGSQGGPKREPSSAASVMMQPGILAGGFMFPLMPPAFLHRAHSCFHRHREPATFLTGSPPLSPIPHSQPVLFSLLSSQPASPFPVFLSSQAASPFPHRWSGPLPLSTQCGPLPLSTQAASRPASFPHSQPVGFPHSQPA